MHRSLFALLALVIAIAVATWIVPRGERSPIVAPSAPNAAVDPPTADDLSPVVGEPVADVRSESETSSAGAETEPAEDAAGPRVTYAMLRVVDAATSEPLTGAEVASRDARVPFRGATDERGEVSVPVAEGSPIVQVLVELDGYLHFRGALQFGRESTIELLPTRVVHGRVLDAASGAVVPGATVGFVHPDCSFRCAPNMVTADAGGRYELEIASAGNLLSLTAEAPEHPTQTVSVELTRRDERGWIADVPIEGGASISGVVYDLVSGEPVAGVRVGRASRLGIEAPTTDAAGRFRTRRLRGEWTGTLDLDFRKPGYCTSSAALENEEAAGAPLRVPLVRSVRLAGTVTDDSGAPAVGTYLQVPTANGEPLPPDPASPLATLPPGISIHPERSSDPLARVDEAGAFELSIGLLPWTAGHAVLVMGDGFEDTWFRVPAAEPGAVVREDVVVVRPRGVARIHGSITLNGMSPSAVVTWRGPTRSGEDSRILSGRYDVDVEPGLVHLTVSLRSRTGPEPVPLAEATVEVEPDTTLEHDFRIERPSGTIAGTVRRANGAPAAGAKVIASHPEVFMGSQSDTDASGAFSLELPDMDVDWTVVAREGWDRVKQDGIALGTEGLELTLPGLAVVRVRAVDATGETVPSPDVAWRLVDLDPWSHASRIRGELAPRELPDGALELDVPVGFVQLRVGKPAFGHPHVERTLTLTPGTTHELDVTLDTVAPVVFHVDPPLPRGARIRVVTTQGAEPDEYALQFDTRAEARVPGLADGEYRLDADDSLDVRPATFRLTGDRARPIELTWTR